MSRFIPKHAKVGQRVKLLTASLTAEGYTYADVTMVHGENHVTAKLIHATDADNRPVMRLSPQDFAFVPGKPRFPHIDGKTPGFGGEKVEGDAEDGNDETDDAIEFGDAIEDDADADATGDAEGDGKPSKAKADGDAPKNPLLEQLEDFVLDVVAEAMIQTPLDEKRVREIASEEAAKTKGGNVIVKVKDLPPVELEGHAHMALQRVLRLIVAGVSKRNIALVGPAGCGKTTLSSQIKAALHLHSFAPISCSLGMSETKLVGRVIPKLTGDDDSVYESTPIVDAYVNGGVILLDELDNSDPSTVTLMNSMLDNGFITLPNGETAIRHPDTVIMASMNTFGHGADRIYVGRNALDGATLDRFTGATLELDYDRALETKLCPEENILKAVWDIRDKVRAAKLRRIVSTRFLLSVRQLHLGVGDSLKSALLACATGWTDGDLKVAGIK
jgi:MoxR-like ATPase